MLKHATISIPIPHIVPVIPSTTSTPSSILLPQLSLDRCIITFDLYLKMSVSPFPCEQVSLTIKLLLLGQSSVGKTSLVNRYTNHVFDKVNTLLTIGIEVRKIIKHLQGKKIRLELWDTSGQERFRTIPANYFRGIQGIMLVYDITSGESFLRVQDWLQRIDQNCVRQKLTLTLVGNKVDLQSSRQVRVEQALEFASNRGMKFSETSAKTAQGVDEMIEAMVLEIMGKGGWEPKGESIKLAVEAGKNGGDKDSCC